jgi:hypothetical protein
MACAQRRQSQLRCCLRDLKQGRACMKRGKRNEHPHPSSHPAAARCTGEMVRFDHGSPTPPPAQTTRWVARRCCSTEALSATGTMRRNSLSKPSRRRPRSRTCGGRATRTPHARGPRPRGGRGGTSWPCSRCRVTSRSCAARHQHIRLLDKGELGLQDWSEAISRPATCETRRTCAHTKPCYCSTTAQNQSIAQP